MVRCADCGFLCHKNHEEKTFDHVDNEARRTGLFPVYTRGGGNISLRHDPYCFVLKYDLPGERKELTDTPPYVNNSEFIDAIRQVISKERTCTTGFTEWRSGFSPKEHKEMVNDAELRRIAKEEQERQLSWQEDRRKEDLAWRAKQEEAAEKRWRHENKLQRHQLVIVGIIGTIILAATQIIAALIQANASSNQPPIIINIPDKTATQR
jgi:hypothetical protein